MATQWQLQIFKSETDGLKIRWAVKGPCRFESGHRQSESQSH